MISDNPNLYSGETAQRLLRAFKFPDNIVTDNELEDYEMGGIALQDPSKGMEFQVWQGYWNPVDKWIYLKPDNLDDPIPIFTEPDVEEFCFTFDQNMRWAAAIRTSTNLCKFLWYDSMVKAYVTTFISNVSSVRLTLDDKRFNQIQFGVADMIITTIEGGIVRWRIQRDRFGVAYSHPGSVSPRARITHFGMGENNRLQWRIASRRVKNG